MGLFDKKFCDFCGNKIGLLGNKKLEDANMCKDCASKLSPWFSERRHSTKADIEKQLAYREQNKAAVAAFKATRTLGTAITKLLIDDNAKKFMVTSAKNLAEANPDVLDFSQAVGCDLDVKENRIEIRQTDSSGKSVSYHPPRYKYSYEFFAIIRVNHPYFDDMRFALSNGYIEVGEQPMNPGQSGGWSVSRSGFNLFGNKIDEYYKCVDCGNEIKAAVDAMRMSAAPQAQTYQKDPRVLAALEEEARNLSIKMEAQKANGYVDPNDSARYLMLTQHITIENERPSDNPELNAKIDEAHSLRAKIDAQLQNGGAADQQDANRYHLLMQQISAEVMQIKTANMRASAMGALGALGVGAVVAPAMVPAGAVGAARPPVSPTDTSGGAIPIVMPVMSQQAPQAASVPPIGSQVVCPMCQATVVIGRAGICTNCGNKIV